MIISVDGDQREAHLESPSVHDGLDIHVQAQGSILMSLLGQVQPQVILGGGLVGQVSQVDSQALTEGVGGQEVVHHPDDGRSFAIGDPVKDLLDLIWMLDRNADWMRTL